MKTKHFEVIRLGIGKYVNPNKSFAMYGVDPPYKSITGHGMGKDIWIWVSALSRPGGLYPLVICDHDISDDFSGVLNCFGFRYRVSHG